MEKRIERDGMNLETFLIHQRIPFNQHSGDVYVLGSGATLDYFEPSFFRNKAVIAVNRAAERLNLYEKNPDIITFSHYHHEDVYPLAERYPHHWFVTPEGDQGLDGHPSERPHNVIYFPHPPTVYDFNVHTAQYRDGLIVGSTSAHGAMHLACALEARFVWLAGIDCGVLDGKTNHGTHPLMASPDGRSDLEVLTRWETHLREVKSYLVSRYGVGIHSINPFLNPNLEGHTWEGPR